VKNKAGDSLPNQMGNKAEDSLTYMLNNREAEYIINENWVLS
jgi:hypothetical protein